MGRRTTRHPVRWHGGSETSGRRLSLPLWLLGLPPDDPLADLATEVRRALAAGQLPAWRRSLRDLEALAGPQWHGPLRAAESRWRAEQG